MTHRVRMVADTIGSALLDWLEQQSCSWRLVLAAWLHDICSALWCACPTGVNIPWCTQLVP